MLEVHRIIRDVRSDSHSPLQRNMIMKAILSHKHSSTQFKQGKMYIITADVENNVLHLSQGSHSIHLYSHSLERALRAC